MNASGASSDAALASEKHQDALALSIYSFSVDVNMFRYVWLILPYLGQRLSLFMIASTQAVQAFLRGKDSSLAPCGSRLRT